MNQPGSQPNSRSDANRDAGAARPRRETIDRPRPEDVPALLGLIGEFGASLDPPDEVTMTEDVLHEALFGDPPSVEFVVVRADEGLCGFATFWTGFLTWTGRRSLFLDSVYVRPDHRRGALAMQVYAYLLRLAKSRGYAEIEGMVSTTDEELNTFYRTLRPVNQYNFYYVDLDAVDLPALNEEV